MKPKIASSRLAFLVIAIAAALVTQPMRATAIQTLDITENSSTSLTAILNGTTSLTVTLNGPDNWTIALTGVFGSGSELTAVNWFEPGGAAAGFVNTVSFDSTSPNQLSVVSERGPGFSVALPNNTPDTIDFTLNGNPLTVTFNDKGDVAAVPDTGTTASLFGLSLVGLAFFRRKLC